MQVAERRNFMDIFYINCFSHSLYLSRARNISCFSCFLTIIYAIYMPKLNTSGGKGKIKKRRVIRKRLKKVGQNAEVMPRPLNWSLVIHSLEVRTIFSLFVLKKHMLGFAQIISVFRTGWSFARVGVGYPVSGTCSRSSLCKWRTGACLF